MMMGTTSVTLDGSQTRLSGIFPLLPTDIISAFLHSQMMKDLKGFFFFSQTGTH